MVVSDHGHIRPSSGRGARTHGQTRPTSGQGALTNGTRPSSGWELQPDRLAVGEL